MEEDLYRGTLFPIKFKYEDRMFFERTKKLLDDTSDLYKQLMFSKSYVMNYAKDKPVDDSQEIYIEILTKKEFLKDDGTEFKKRVVLLEKSTIASGACLSDDNKYVISTRSDFDHNKPPRIIICSYKNKLVNKKQLAYTIGRYTARGNGSVCCTQLSFD
jgi:hypothetical protein